MCILWIILKSLEDEYNAAKKLGIDAELVNEVNLPFNS